MTTRSVRVATATRLAMTAIVCIFLAGCAGKALEPDAISGVVNYRTVEMFYATDRARSTDEDDDLWYSGRRGAPVFGDATVDVPIALPDQDESSLLSFGNRRIRDAVVRELAELSSDSLVQRLSATVAASERKDLMLFIHGYNTSFDDAMRRTAQIAWDTRFNGAAVAFSWPSKTSVTGYTADEAAVDWATTHLTEFLDLLVTRSGAERIILVAHSMGTRALTEAIIRVQRQRGKLSSIRHIVLAAPDIDADIFTRDIASHLVHPARQVTLYASSRDRALELSEQLHDYPRAGDSGSGLVIYPGIDTIDATAVDTSFLGHNYYGENVSIMADLRQLLRDDASPSERKSIAAARSAPGSYWLLLPEAASQ